MDEGEASWVLGGKLWGEWVACFAVWWVCQQRSHFTGWGFSGGFCPDLDCFWAEYLWWCQAVWEGNMTWQDKVCRKFSSTFGQEPQRQWDWHSHSATQPVTRPLTCSLPVTQISLSHFQTFNPSLLASAWWVYKTQRSPPSFVDTVACKGSVAMTPKAEIAYTGQNPEE